MIYNGILDPSKMSKGAKQGYVSWANQRAKCNNKKDPSYKYYGGKGVCVHYSSREFVGWWLKGLKIKKWKDPSVGRIDHDGDYCFENIEMQEMQDNRSERCRRLGRPIPEKTAPKKVASFSASLKKKLKDFDSITLAARHYGLEASTVVRHCQKKFNGSRCGMTFRYAEAQD